MGIQKGRLMKKFIVAVFIIGAFIIYSFIYDHSNVVPLLPESSNNSSSSTSIVPTTSNIPTAPSTAGNSGAQYKDGSYTGSVADAQWGNLQVKAVIKGGKITDVQFLQFPNDRNRSVDINSYADPQLANEAIQTQSANVDIVTGATDSSDAFVQSLSDALSQAKA
jgi:uncharacterized protein with FMN-binding domain